MPIDIEAARRFVHANARLIERRRLAVLLDGAPADHVVAALRAYRNPDGGFGNALEPDIRTPTSEPAGAVDALRVLAEVGALDDPMVAGVATWAATIAEPDGGVPFMLPAAADYPHAPFLSPSPGSSFLTFALAGRLWEAGAPAAPWLVAATDWCWAALEQPGELHAYGVLCALEFLDAVPDGARAEAALERLRPRLREDGSIAVQGGTEDEQLSALMLSPRPGARSRALFTDDQIAADLDALERRQQDDGGWEIDYLKWSPAQAIESRGVLTLAVLATLRGHGRLAAGSPAAQPANARG